MESRTESKTESDIVDLQIAIRESLQTQNTPQATQFADPPPVDPSDPNNSNNKQVRRVNIDDRIKEIALQPASELPLVNDPSGDTWIFIDPPPKQPEQDDVDYTWYLKHCETPMLIKKDMLLRYHTPNSDGFNLEPLFGPSAQFRIVRRRNLTAKLRQNPQIKYVIELTPPTEGEDAVFLTTELCCSQGVRLWYQAGDIWRVSKSMVGGTEEYTSARTKNSDHSNGPSSPANIVGPSEYSPVRHRSAIERVIAALMDIDPKLDSAPKVWTTFAVANYFSIKNSPLTDYIIRWLRAYPNSFFLEVCPEVSLRIADGLENQDLARDTFAILVGEEALDSLVRTHVPNKNNRYSTYGRKREELPERIFSRIEYASKSFQERIRTDLEDLAGEKMKWIEDLPEFQKLRSLQEPKLSNTFSVLTHFLKDYVRGTILKLLKVNYDYVPTAEYHDVSRVPGELIHRINRTEVWADLSAGERVLSRTFWLALISFTLFEGPSNLDIRDGWNLDWENAQLNQAEPGLRLGTYREVQTEDLNHLIWEGEFWLAKQAPQPQFTLPDRTRSQAQVESRDANNEYNRSDRSFDDLYDAQITFSEDTVSEPVGELKPTSSIDVPQHTPRAHQEPLPSGRELLHNMNTAFHDGPAVLPDGRPRQDWWDIETTDDQNHRNLSDTDTRAMADLPTADNQYQRPTPADLPYYRKRHQAAAKGEFESQLSTRETKNESPTRPCFGGFRPLLPKPETATKKSSIPVLANTLFFDLDHFFSQARDHIRTIAKQKLQCADCGLRNEPHEVGITNTLICLDDSEWKYLPLWAGGFDDGTGGVFSEQLPTDDLGFSAPGPTIHTGFTPANSNSAASEFDMADSEYGTDTINTSMVNNRSIAGALNRKHVYAADSMESSSGDDFEIVSAIEDPLEEDARRQTEAQERIEAAEEEAAARVERNRGGKLLDENYADLFADYEDDEDTDRANDSDSTTGDDAMDDDIEMV